MQGGSIVAGLGQHSVCGGERYARGVIVWRSVAAHANFPEIGCGASTRSAGDDRTVAIPCNPTCLGLARCGSVGERVEQRNYILLILVLRRRSQTSHADVVRTVL